MSRAGCPNIVRSDHGTENTLLAATHMSLRHGHVDDFKGKKSYRFGSSTTNTVSLNKGSREVLIIIPVFLWYILLSLLSENRKLVGTITKFSDRLVD